MKRAMNQIWIAIIIYTAAALAWSPSSCHAFSSSSFTLQHYRTPGITSLNQDLLRPRWRLSFRNSAKMENTLKGKLSYSLGLVPFKQEYNKTTIKDSSKPVEAKGTEPEKVAIEVPKEIIDEMLKDIGTSSANSTQITSETAPQEPNRYIPVSVQMSIKPTASGLYQSILNDKTEQALKEKKKSINLFADTISQSINFFEDKQNLPRYTAPKKQVPIPFSSQQSDPATPEPVSVQFFDYFENKEQKAKAEVPRASPLLISGNRTAGDLDPSALLTLADLQLILNQNGYIRRDEVSSILSNPMQPQTGRNATANSDKTKSGVALPQPTVLSNKHVKNGSMISSGFFGTLLLITIKPNLWLVGGFLGALYGGDIAEKSAVIAHTPAPLPTISADGSVVPSPPNSIPGGLYGELTLKYGKKIATAYLQLWDLFQGVWFMYRTGQLSYQYYKTYEGLDKRFGIQTKMDAWNARFIEGKVNFDSWEKENEIGRKVLAGLRTAWMVEESSYKKQLSRKKGRKRSKYRLIQTGIDATDWFKRLFRALWGVLRGGSNAELNEIINGVRMGLQQLNLEIFSQRTGAAIAALVAVNFVGALFSVAPYLLGLTAIISGIIWPNWMGNTSKVFKDFIDETRARGRGEQVVQKARDNAPKSKLPVVDKNSFSFYVGNDGKKKWYRTGKSYKNEYTTREGNDGSDTNIVWPWQNNNGNKQSRQMRR